MKIKVGSMWIILMLPTFVFATAYGTLNNTGYIPFLGICIVRLFKKISSTSILVDRLTLLYLLK